MNSSSRKAPGLPENPGRGLRLWSLIAFGGLLALALLGFFPRPKGSATDTAAATNASVATTRSQDAIRIPSGHRHSSSTREAEPAPAAEEIVAAKLAQFARSRRELTQALARRHGIEVPESVSRFFDAVESGNWDEIQARFKVINGGDSSASPGAGRPPGVNDLWSPIIDAYGAAEQVHDWPAQKLLDYGNAVLGALRPGMVYVGGTDNGRWVPELLNDTSDGERHIVLTQNGLADGKYVEYATELYGDRMAMLTREDSQKVFQDYISDAQQRLQHDQQFPDEPKQIRPGESVTSVDGKVQVSGMVAVMQINERLLQTLLQKNPDLSFAVQESFPMKGTYADAAPLGPLMELRATDGQTGFTADSAAQAMDYWRTTAQNVLADPEAAASPTTLKSYSHDANSMANLLADHSYAAEAEQAYRLSSQLWPGNPDAVGGLATLLARQGQTDQARQLLDDFARNHPDQLSAVDKMRSTFLWSGPQAK